MVQAAPFQSEGDSVLLCTFQDVISRPRNVGEEFRSHPFEANQVITAIKSRAQHKITGYPAGQAFLK